MFVQLWMSSVIVAHSCSRTSTLATCPHIGVTAMAGVRRMSWPWSSLRLRLSASRSEDSSSASSYSPSPSAKEVCTHVCMNLLVVGTLHVCSTCVCVCMSANTYTCVCIVAGVLFCTRTLYPTTTPSCHPVFFCLPPPPPSFSPSYTLSTPDFPAHTGA